jgi:predicted membrane metal-binding protein
MSRDCHVTRAVSPLLLGDDQAVTQSLRDRFRASGLYHLLRLAKEGE